MSPTARKVLDIFTRLPGANLPAITPNVPSDTGTIAAALAEEFGLERANDIAFHLTDWTYDAAFLVALALFPAHFTAEEIEAGVGGFLIHVPNHVAAAAKLSGNPIQDTWKLDVLDKRDIHEQ
jgi:hypothetical protein